MKIKVLDHYSCEPCFSNSSRDTRFDIEVDGKLKIQAVRCDDKHSDCLGDVRIERIFVGEKSFWPSNFSDLTLELGGKYNAEDLEEKLQAFLENL